MEDGEQVGGGFAHQEFHVELLRDAKPVEGHRHVLEEDETVTFLGHARGIVRDDAEREQLCGHHGGDLDVPELLDVLLGHDLGDDSGQDVRGVIVADVEDPLGDADDAEVVIRISVTDDDRTSDSVDGHAGAVVADGEEDGRLAMRWPPF